MKKEIMELVASQNGKFRLNNICYLERWQECLCGKCDCLEIRFNNINHVCFGFSKEIKSRDYDGIMTEAEEAIKEFLNEVSRRLTSDLRAGYRNDTCIG